MTTIAAVEAYEKAGIGPEDLSFVELQDTDASGEILFSEELLLFKEGEGGPAVSDGVTELGGRLPISTDGGIISKGEPVGASALGQIYEAVVQLRGQAGQETGCQRESRACPRQRGTGALVCYDSKSLGSPR